MTNLLKVVQNLAIGASILSLAACSNQQPVEAAEPEGTSQVVAIFDGEPITDDDLGIKGELTKLAQEIYKARQEALDGVIIQRVLEKEAKKNGIGVEELLNTNVDGTVEKATAAEVRAFYEQRKSRFRKPFEEVEEQATSIVEALNIREARLKYAASLRKDSNLEILISAPRLPINLENAHRRGPLDAPVTLVEFSDFQCPFCKRVQPTLESLFEEYEGKISWVYKDLPLVSIHPDAVGAAEAARCAGDQGKFWEYRDALFAESRVTKAVHPKIVEALELDAAAFDECISSNKYTAAVQADGAEAQSLGISGTPAFVVNGILLSGAQPKEAFVSIIDAAIAASDH
jgi:protein-disulfide isomerase